MRGTDVTPEQIAQAEKLYLRAAKGHPNRDPVTLTRDTVLRLMAWYAAIRCEAIKPGSSHVFGTLVDRDGVEFDPE